MGSLALSCPCDMMPPKKTSARRRSAFLISLTFALRLHQCSVARLVCEGDPGVGLLDASCTRSAQPTAPLRLSRADGRLLVSWFPSSAADSSLVAYYLPGCSLRMNRGTPKSVPEA